MRHPDLLSRHSSRLLIVDMQAKILPRIHEGGARIQTCRRLIQGAKILGVPVFATEQYPQGLGETVPELAELLPPRPTKLKFSSFEALSWGMAGEQADNRFQIVVTGIEAHVCVLQSVLDLLTAGYGVFVPADAVSSRRASDAQIALSRMASAGATIVTSESVLFEWCEVAGTPEFKEISRLVKEAPA
jgi:nicotinamidase-related amidase